MNEGNLVILAGGVSSRMRRLPSDAAHVDAAALQEAQTKPKSLISTDPAGRPFLDYVLYNAREAGYTDVVIVVGEENSAFRACYGSKDQGNIFQGLTISYAVQRIPAGRIKPLGTADAVLQALRSRPDWQGTWFTVCNSDNLYSPKALKLLLNATDPGAIIDYDREALRFGQNRIAQFAVLSKDADGYLTDIIEKPTPEQLAGAADASGRVGVSMNIFRFSVDRILPVLSRVPLHPSRKEQELPTAVMMLIAEDRHFMKTIPLAEYVPDLTHPDDIATVRDYLRQHFPQYQSIDRA